MLFTERLIEISVEYFIRGGIIQILMKLSGIVEVNETEKLNVPIGAAFKVNLAVPHVHQGADNPLSFTVGLRTINTSKLLTDTVLPASLDESMGVSSFKFFAVIRISIVDLVRTLSNSACEKASCTMLGFIRKNIGIQLPGEIIDGHK